MNCGMSTFRGNLPRWPDPAAIPGNSGLGRAGQRYPDGLPETVRATLVRELALNRQA